ncbi:Hypothetical protein GOX0432 [Gluconobacter oxydans 621H]|uniref:Uncharacterized protein n=1 Tax=Gluconobacter oxydans (strain 621H) TaxID=290633 RepID=Q5FTT1_GLUOX|nr:Hypothetical protein GOX0432 [Gluconobacter oxydans 621H]
MIEASYIRKAPPQSKPSANENLDILIFISRHHAGWSLSSKNNTSRATMRMRCVKTGFQKSPPAPHGKQHTALGAPAKETGKTYSH